MVSFDYRVLLTVAWPTMVERLCARTTNSYGRTAAELDQVRCDLEEVEPLLRRSADLVVDTALPIEEVADRVLSACGTSHFS